MTVTTITKELLRRTLYTTASAAMTALSIVIAASCDKAEERFSDRPCYFMFRADYHNTHILVYANWAKLMGILYNLNSSVP